MQGKFFHGRPGLGLASYLVWRHGARQMSECGYPHPSVFATPGKYEIIWVGIHDIESNGFYDRSTLKHAYVFPSLYEQVVVDK